MPTVTLSSQLALEKEELRIHLQASKDAQRQLTAEVSRGPTLCHRQDQADRRPLLGFTAFPVALQLKEVQDRNAECVGMLQESQEEVRGLRSKSAQSAGVRRHLPYTLFPTVSPGIAVRSRWGGRAPRAPLTPVLGSVPQDSLAAEIEGSMNRELSMEDENVLQDQRWALAT